MKRGQMGEADKHAIRRKIEEKQVLIREQRKVCWVCIHPYPCPVQIQDPEEQKTLSAIKNDECTNSFEVSYVCQPLRRVVPLSALRVQHSLHQVYGTTYY